jgi:hypothetical protein
MQIPNHLSHAVNTWQQNRLNGHPNPGEAVRILGELCDQGLQAPQTVDPLDSPAEHTGTSCPSVSATKSGGTTNQATPKPTAPRSSKQSAPGIHEPDRTSAATTAKQKPFSSTKTPDDPPGQFNTSSKTTSTSWSPSGKGEQPMAEPTSAGTYSYQAWCQCGASIKATGVGGLKAIDELADARLMKHSGPEHGPATPREAARVRARMKTRVR